MEKKAKYKVYQISPERTESPYCDLDEMYEGIAIFGNRDFKEIFGGDPINKVYEALFGKSSDCFCNDFDNVGADADFDSITDCINYYLPPQSKERYSTKEIRKLKELLDEFWSANGRGMEDERFCDIASIVTGKKYDYRNIHGCCQRDWNTLYFPVDSVSDDSIRYIEGVFFNTGDEWSIREGDEEVYRTYTVESDINKVRGEIADVLGVEPSQLEMYLFDGYDMIARYKAAV